MTKRENHYETAVEAYLRERRIPYVAVDETKRSRWGDESLKSLDFLISPPSGPSWLVDVKGRRFPSAGGQYWRNWSTADELRSLARWEELFGPRFTGLLVFAYHVLGEWAPLGEEHLFEHRGRLYGLVGVRLDHYVSAARVISRKWDTLGVAKDDFRRLARPVGAFFDAARPAAA